jgi:hypothetical protein
MKGTMGKRISETARKIGVLGLFLTGAFFANAQSNIDNPAWIVSKDVQRLANKKMFQDENIRSSHIYAVQVSPTWMISKGVHRTASDQVSAKGNVKSKGIPLWTISKGVQRIGRK